LDELRELVSGNNLRWWALTTAISLLHAVFSYLAFSHDVCFWRGKTSLEGLSVRTFVSSLVCQSIIFLKLLDGGNVSWLIASYTPARMAPRTIKLARLVVSVDVDGELGVQLLLILLQQLVPQRWEGSAQHLVHLLAQVLSRLLHLRRGKGGQRCAL